MRVSGKGESPQRSHPILYSRPGKNMGDILGYAVHTITLKPAPVRAVLHIPEVQECSAPRANSRVRGKKRDASVKPVSFSGNSGLKVSTSVCRMKNRNSPKKSLMFFRTISERLLSIMGRQEFAYWETITGTRK